MVSYLQDKSQETVDSVIQVIFDPAVVSSKFILSDTLKVIDVGNYFDHPASIFSIVAIIIALWAIIKPLYDQYKTRIQLKEYALFFSQQLIDTFDKKIDLIKSLAKNIEDIDSNRYEYNPSLTYRASNLLSIPQNEFFRIFVSKNKSTKSDEFKHYKELFDSIAYFVGHDKHAEINYAQYISSSRRHGKKFQDNFNSIFSLYNEFRSSSIGKGINPSDDQFLYEINPIGQEYLKMENRERHSVIVEMFVEPLKAFTTKHYADGRAIELLKSIEGCEDADFQLRDTNTFYSLVFNELAVTLEKRRNSLAEAIEYFQ